MGGCSSKPQTAECSEGLIFHTDLKTSDSCPHQTLKSLFNQHGRDDDDLLEDTQTLHELLLHSVDPKELPDFENQSAGNTDADLQTRALQPDLISGSPCKLNSPVSVLSHAAEKNASECTNAEGSLPNLAESNKETGAKVESFAQVTEENAEKSTQTQGSTPNLAEGNQEKGASNLKGSQSGLAEVTTEKCGNLELVPSALPEENVENCIKMEGFNSNEAETNQANARKLEGFVSNLAEVKLQEECSILLMGAGALSNLAEENRIKSDSVSSPESQLNQEPKSDLLKSPESNSSERADFETWGLHLGPKSKISEPNLLESLITDVFGNIKTSDTMESKEAEAQGSDGVDMKSEIKREVQDEIATETKKTPKQEEKAMKCEKNERALPDQETKEQSRETIEGEETENTVEGMKTEMQALKIENNEISHKEEKAEVQNENAREGELPLMAEDEKAGVQNERAVHCEVEKIQRDEEDEKAICMEKLGIVQDADEKDSQEKKKTGVQGGPQIKKAGWEEEEAGVQHEERTSPVNQCLAFKSDHTDSCFQPLSGSEQSFVAIECVPPTLELASKENTVEAAELGFIDKFNESDCKDNTANVVANLRISEKLEGDLKKLVPDENSIEAAGLKDIEKLVPDENSIEAAGLEDIEKLEFEQKKTEKAEHIETIESSIEAVAVGQLAKLCNTIKVLDNGQSKSTDSEERLHIESHGKLEHDTLGAPQHSEADEVDDKTNAKATVLEESSIEAAVGHHVKSDDLVLVVDGTSASEPCACEERKESEVSEEQRLHEGHAREESSNIQCPSKLVVVENDNSDDSDEKVKMDVSGEEHGFVQKDNDAEMLQCGHIQMRIQELDLVVSERVERHSTQAHNESALRCVHEKLSSPTIVAIDVEKHVVETSSSGRSAAEKGIDEESVESKPEQNTSGEVEHDTNEKAHMEASKQGDEKGEEGIKAAEICESER